MTDEEWAKLPALERFARRSHRRWELAGRLLGGGEYRGWKAEVAPGYKLPAFRAWPPEEWARPEGIGCEHWLYSSAATSHEAVYDLLSEIDKLDRDAELEEEETAFSAECERVTPELLQVDKAHPIGS